MAQGSELIAKVFALLAESGPDIVNLLSGAQSVDAGAGSEVADRRVFLDPRPWPPRSRAAVALQELRIPSKTQVPSAFEFGVVSAKNFVENARVKASLGLELTSTDFDFWCITGVPKVPPRWRKQFELGMLAGLSMVSAEDRAELQAIDKLKDRLVDGIAGGL